MTPEQLTATEDEIAALWNAGELPYLTHLAGSKDGKYEQWLCDLFEHIGPNDWVLASHRAHFHYLLHGHTDIVERVRDGKSMFLYGRRFIQSAIVAGTCSIAVGLAMAIKARGGTEQVWCFVGDGAVDHGHFHEAMRCATSKQLPVTFIIEDNDSSCGVTKAQRGALPPFGHFPDKVMHHQYTPKYPHAGTGQPMTLKRTTP